MGTAWEQFALFSACVPDFVHSKGETDTQVKIPGKGKAEKVR